MFGMSGTILRYYETILKISLAHFQSLVNLVFLLEKIYS